MEAKELTKALRSFHEGKISEEEMLKEIEKSNPLEISIAEQNLLDEGVDESELKEFCKVHLKAVEEKLDRIRSRLEDEHPIKILISEHAQIQEILNELGKLGEKLKDKYLNDQDVEKLQKLSENLVESEKHHEREEETIFPKLENKGIDGPPRIMREDHDKFKPKKKRLRELSEDPEENKEELIELIDFLTFNLRDHIFKENNILYPTALDELENWDAIKKEGNKIGYCSFLPSDPGNLKD